MIKTQDPRDHPRQFIVGDRGIGRHRDFSPDADFPDCVEQSRRRVFVVAMFLATCFKRGDPLHFHLAAAQAFARV